MEFAEEGGEGPTPYEVLLHAAMVGDSTRFTRQDGVEETWRIMQPLLDEPPPVHAYAPGSWGPEGSRRARRRPRAVARAMDRVMSATAAKERMPQSAAAPSPFPPIAEYAFLSNCHTGALIAPDGAIDWLCVPRFDSPSVFGSLLDREAGFFRFGPFGINHPTVGRLRPRNERARDDLEDAERLDRRPRRADDGAARPRGHDHAAHPPAGRRRRRSHARADGRVHRGQRRGRADLRARIRLRPRAGGVGTGRRRTARRRRERRRADVPAPDRSRARHRGEPRPGAPRARGRRARLLRPVLGRGSRRAGECGRGLGAHRCDVALLARLAQPRADPGSPVPRPDPTLGAHDQGPHVHADRSNGGRAHDLAAGDSRRRAELGLPLHLDPRHDVHAPGAALPQPRLGGRRVHAVRRRRRADRGRVAADHVRHRRSPRPHGDDARRDDRLRRRAARAHRQRRVRPAPERRLRRRPRLDPAAYEEERAPAAAALADRREPGRVRDEGLARAGPGDLGGARQAAALRLLEADVLGRARPGGEARRATRRRRSQGEVGRRRRRDPRGHPRARRATSAASCASTTTRTRSTLRRCWRRSSTSFPTTTNG